MTCLWSGTKRLKIKPDCFRQFGQSFVTSRMKIPYLNESYSKFCTRHLWMIYQNDAITQFAYNINIGTSTGKAVRKSSSDARTDSCGE